MMGSLNEENSVKTLPKENYTLVAVDIDTTGKRLIDEIVQLAAFTPKSHFEQYIMPYMNLNPAARNRHQVRVITIGFYRMLKSLQTYKVIKSKSEVAALKDFLNWLEVVKKNDTNSKGVVLIYHEERKFIPYMILEALKKYDLLGRFQETVKSFVNGYYLAQNHVSGDEGGLPQYLSLRKLSKVLFCDKNNNDEKVSTTSPASPMEGGQNVNGNNNKIMQRNRKKSNCDSEIFDGSANIRAKMAYEVALRLTNQNKNAEVKVSEYEQMMDVISHFAQPLARDLAELDNQNMILERQNSFRPVFLNYFKATLQHRLRAVKYRIILAENGHDLSSLNTIWNEKRQEGLAEVIQAINDLKQDDKTELIELFDSFYDPAKATIKPVVKPTRRTPRRSGRNKENDAAGDANREAGDKQVQPDSTTRAGTRKPQRARRGGGPRPRNNSLPNTNSLNNAPFARASATDNMKVPLISNL